MNIHKLLMGAKWAEMPAQTVHDKWASKIVGNTMIGTMVLLAGSIVINVIQMERIEELKKENKTK